MVLRVKVEIVPFGDEQKSYELGRLDIFNKGYISFGHCEYGVIELDVEGNTGGLYDNIVTHKRDEGYWVLLNKVINELILGHLVPRKGKKMNGQTLETNTGNLPVTAEVINSIDPKQRDLFTPDGLSADELEKLIAIKAVDEPIDGTIIGYVTVDAEDETDEEVVH